MIQIKVLRWRRMYPDAMTPDDFARRCRTIIATRHGHDAHRALDLLTNDVLRQLGYGAGIDLFEAAVARWHAASHPYPSPGPCPDCEQPIVAPGLEIAA